ncbi:MAG: hypothetical protein A3H06_00410 [Candidatus Colwellbacteria bacterium RIFCSPLOWO2_12_FULL_44_13]|uniref:Uncharacterized protein n=3 Tax=Candidatus Colwelliibacteriota TaxID=1817904 RepID=A0A1G1Z5V8_9BACT|nr:MAG: hypothetical protein A3F24_02020 [Candidatus Colwellbacteria bacterium RIFCSPHIGHO2_12_FULL_44_17]OGY59829.1 MAG: hypothetical protein A3I31_01635 [Candidatus Colwellbacteria bacterium RIFCSPLOWO2_02_FULL_44_20b]OGY61554.1 MAG: hypothetical protein A3H06_00410 [Candidatus Colwellbacteria bacterium RIFCSPLOWO2_12_FULL_44_13]
MNYPISHSHSNDTETETSFDIETIELRRIIENVSVELAVQKDILGYCCMELMGIAKPLQQAIPLIDIGVPEAIDDYVYDLGEKFYEIFARRELEKDVEAAYVVIKLNFEVPMLRQTPQGIRIRRFGSRDVMVAAYQTIQPPVRKDIFIMTPSASENTIQTTAYFTLHLLQEFLHGYVSY